MSVRSSYEIALNEVKSHIMKMGKDVEQALQLALEGLGNDDAKKLETVIKEDRKINEQELKINEKVTLMIAKQQPVATDLRRLIVALKISSDLERIGDLTVDVSKISQRLSSFNVGESKERLLDIADVVQEMFAYALAAYYESDILQAQKIATMDDIVDKMYGEFIRDLFQASTGKEKVEQVTNLAFIGRYLERIADYATNLAEWVVYEVNGQYFDLN